MSKIDEVRAEMVAAMKNKDKERKDSLSMLLSALKNRAIDKREDLTEAVGAPFLFILTRLVTLKSSFAIA